MSRLIDSYRAFILDLDGVVYLLDDPVPGAVRTVNALKEEGKKFVFLTNNSVATKEMYADKLAGLGVSIDPDQVVSSAQAVRRYIEMQGEGPGRSAFVIGERGLTRELEAAGLRLVGADEARGVDMVVVGWDRHFDFDKLKAAVIAIRNGARFIATNVDATYPTPEGLWPGAGSIVAAVATGAGEEPFVAGKPNPLIVELALERMDARAGETLLVGDRLDTDVEVGLRAGVDTLLVLTGVSKEKDIAETGVTPTHIRPALAALLEP